MARSVLPPARSAFYALGCVLVLAACGGSDPTAPGPGATAQNPPPGQSQPPSTPAQPPSSPTPPPVVTADSLAGTYVLTRINDSKPGQMVTLANPDGRVIALYRFDASTQLRLDVPEHFDLDIRFSDDKGQYAFHDTGRYQAATPPASQLGLTFTSAVNGEKFTGAADDSSVGIAYDTDGDGSLDTFFFFQRADP